MFSICYTLHICDLSYHGDLLREVLLCPLYGIVENEGLENLSEPST